MATQQERVHQVLLQDNRLIEHDVLDAIDKLYASPSAHTNWLHDPIVRIGSLDAALPELSHKLHVLSRQIKSFWDDVESTVGPFPQLLDLFDIFLQKVLPCDLLVPKEVVDFLEIT